MKKWIVGLLMLGALGGGYYWWSTRQAETPAGKDEAPKTAKATRGTLRATVEATGRVVPEQEVEIKCKASGEVIKLPVDVSDTVKKGDLLVQLDPEDEERKVKRARVNLAVTEARLAQAKLAFNIAERELKSERLRAESSLLSAQVKAEDALARLERLQQLRTKSIASEEEVDAARATQAQANAALKDAQARIEDLGTDKVRLESKQHDIVVAEQQVEADRIALADAKERLAETKVMAPITGVVAERNVQEGQIIASGVSNVGGGTSVLVIADLSRIYVLVSVDESDIGRVAVGQPATITVDAYPNRKMTGTVRRVATKGAVTSNVVTFEVKVEVTGQHKSLLKPEMTANVEIVTVDKENALLVPVAAVKRRRRESTVQVQSAPGEFESRIVEVGESDGESIEVIKGLAEGETVQVSARSNSRWNADEASGGSSQRRRRGPPHL